MLFPLLLLVAWIGVELVDPFPNSLWLIRVLGTKYLVHVRADLTVDGEPLVLERTIRCFHPVDFKLWASRKEEQPGIRSNGQAGDTVAGTTSRGRLFAMNVPDACGSLGSRLRADRAAYVWTDPATNAVTPVRLSKDDIGQPLLFEIFGGRKAERIDAYIDPQLLRKGYHGVRLDEILVEPAHGVLLKDWNGYDWFGGPNWTRPSFGNKGRYSAHSLWAVPEERWQEVLALTNIGQHPDWGLHQQVLVYLDKLRHEDVDRSMSAHDLSPNIFYDVLTTWENASQFSRAFQLMSGSMPMPVRALPDWIPQSIIPCVRTDVLMSYTCDPDKYGIQSFEPYLGMAWLRTPNPETYHFPGHTLINAKEWNTSYSSYLSINPRILYSTHGGEAVLVRRSLW